MTLIVDFVSHEATVYACTNWHYSKCIPSGKLIKIGAWENKKYIGVIIFSRGAAPKIGSPFGLTQTEVCELTRVALSKHNAPVSQIIAHAMRLLKQENPGLRLVVSYADPAQGHHGGIYQAGNWTYTGSVPMRWIRIKGKLKHPKSLYSTYGTQSIAWLKKHIDPAATWEKVPNKHKYVMPLDRAMRRQIQHLARPYPHADEASTVMRPEHHSGRGRFDSDPSAL